MQHDPHRLRPPVHSPFPPVTTVHVSGDILWDDVAFAGLPQPIVLNRNVTLVGERSPATGYYPTVAAPAVRKVGCRRGSVAVTLRGGNLPSSAFCLPADNNQHRAMLSTPHPTPPADSPSP